MKPNDDDKSEIIIKSSPVGWVGDLFTESVCVGVY